MAVPQAVISYDLSQMNGSDLLAGWTFVRAYTNIPAQTIIDTSSGAQLLGDTEVQVPDDGLGSITIPRPGGTSNPESWQTSFQVRYRLASNPGVEAIANYGPYTITGDANLGDLVAQIPVPPELGSAITVSAADAKYDRKSQLNASDYVSLAAALTDAGSGSVDVVFAPKGTYNISTPLTVPAGVELRLAPGAVINNTVWNQNAVVLGAGSSLRGGTIASPSTWDGTNSTWTYAVVMVEGDDATVDGVTLQNVPRVGIGIRNVNTAIVTNNRIKGNYPSAQWTEVETVHFGVGFDPSGLGVDGNVVIMGNVIDQCVQGVFLGNYTGGGTGRGVAVTGNAISNCWNHGVYGYGNNYSVGGNSFNRCQIPVALSGNFHTVSGNSMYTPTTGGTDQRDDTGISMRDCTGCVVIGNTIRGNAKALSAVIDVRALTGTVCSDNTVMGNTIHVEGGSSVGIRVGNGATTCDGNTVQGNTVRCNGNPSTGVIALVPSATGRGNSVINNTVVMEAGSHGIYVAQQQGAIISGNHVRLEYDAASAITLGMVFMVGNSSDCTVQGNVFATSAAWGTNVTIRAIYENSGTTGNRYINNTYLPNTTKLAAYVPLFTQGGGALVNECGPGAPNFAAGVGSLWRRTDGGAATTLYVKESGVGSAGWVGK